MVYGYLNTWRMVI